MKFTKMHGLGNDYIYVDCFKENIKDPAMLAKTLSDRHTSIGSDGLIMMCPSQTAQLRMRIFNADGSEAEMCGNGIRCVAKYAYEHKLAKSTGSFSIPNMQEFEASIKIETNSGILNVGLMLNNKNLVEKVCVNMGQPVFDPKAIPVATDMDKIIEEPLKINGQQLMMTCISMGNPHAVFFCDNIDEIKLNVIGSTIENHSMFPNKINVHFVQVIESNRFKMRTWERGSGITMACGTGACACCAAAAVTERCLRASVASLPAGELMLNWCQQDNCVYMTGPAVEVFSGQIRI